MKNLMLFAVVILGTASSGGVVTKSVTASYDAQTRLATIRYEIEGEPAVVTLDVKVGGQSVGDGNLWRLTGDVNRKVGIGEHEIVWRPDLTWPGVDGLAAGAVEAVVTAWPTNAPPDYMVVDLCHPKDIRYYPSEAAIPDGIASAKYKTDCLVMRKIPARNVRWRMGSKTDDSFYRPKDGSEMTHYVNFTQDYYLGVYLVTHAQYRHATGGFKGAWYNDYAHEKPLERPVNTVNYNDLRGSTANWPTTGHVVGSNCVIDKFRRHAGVEFDLPTEAQWEFACRAGTQTAFNNGKNVDSEGDSANLREIAWAYYSSGARNHPVGELKPNGWGLYDMCGNAWEFCLDWYALPSGSEETDPKGPDSGETRVRRGGTYNSGTSYCRSAARSGVNPGATAENFYGFRLWAPAVAP